MSSTTGRLITRRKLLFGTAGTVLLLPLSCWIRTRRQLSKDIRLEHIGSRESQVLLALKNALVPESDSNEFKLSEEKFLTEVNRLLEVSSPQERTEISILLFMTEYILPLFVFYFRPYSQLEIKKQQEILLSLENSSREWPKLAARALKSIVTFGYYNTDEARAYLGLKDWCGP